MQFESHIWLPNMSLSGFFFSNSLINLSLDTFSLLIINKNKDKKFKDGSNLNVFLKLFQATTAKLYKGYVSFKQYHVKTVDA